MLTCTLRRLKAAYLTVVGGNMGGAWLFAFLYG